MLKIDGKRVYLACGKTDMRKSINGLAAIVEGNFLLDPFDEALFVFCNRNRDRIKILEWDGDGFWLHFKRLEKGHFRWPSEGEQITMTLTGEELQILLGGSKSVPVIHYTLPIMPSDNWLIIHYFDAAWGENPTPEQNTNIIPSFSSPAPAPIRVPIPIP